MLGFVYWESITWPLLISWSMRMFVRSRICPHTFSSSNFKWMQQHLVACAVPFIRVKCFLLTKEPEREKKDGELLEFILRSFESVWLWCNSKRITSYCSGVVDDFSSKSYRLRARCYSSCVRFIPNAYVENFDRKRSWDAQKGKTHALSHLAVYQESILTKNHTIYTESIRTKLKIVCNLKWFLCSLVFFVAFITIATFEFNNGFKP